MTPRLALLALVLLALACSAPESVTPCDVWLEPEHPLYAAQHAWGMPLPWVPAYDELDMPGEDLAAECGSPGEYAMGCALWSQHRVPVMAGLPDDLRLEIQIHELGHILAAVHRGVGFRARHIADPQACPRGEAGAYVMCSSGSVALAGLTPEDFDFVLGLGAPEHAAPAEHPPAVKAEAAPAVL